MRCLPLARGTAAVRSCHSTVIAVDATICGVLVISPGAFWALKFGGFPGERRTVGTGDSVVTQTPLGPGGESRECTVTVGTVSLARSSEAGVS